MSNESIKSGQKFFYKSIGVDYVLTIYMITKTRVCYSDGQKHSSGASNRKVKGAWLTIKNFSNKIDQGEIVLI